MKITAVVPVYKEVRTIKGVVEVLLSSPLIDKLIVIDGGSDDGTKEILKNIRSKKIKQILMDKPNGGKGGAVKIATEGLKSDIIFFCDADLIGLTHNHIAQIIDPIIKENATMAIGLRDKESVIGNLIMPYFPLTGGERAILTKDFMKIRNNNLISGWGLESVMNDYCWKKKLKIAKVRLNGMDHIGVQTKKYGLVAFIKEIYDVISTKIKLVGVRYD